MRGTLRDKEECATHGGMVGGVSASSERPAEQDVAKNANDAYRNKGEEDRDGHPR